MMRGLPIICLLLTAPLHAAEPSPIVGGSEVASMLTSTLIVVGIIVALAWLYSRSRLSVTGPRDVIQVVASRALGTKERLLLIEVADQQLLVGMTSTNVQTLHVFDKPVDIQIPEPKPVGNFSDRLKATLSEIRK